MLIFNLSPSLRNCNFYKVNNSFFKSNVANEIKWCYNEKKLLNENKKYFNSVKNRNETYFCTSIRHNIRSLLCMQDWDQGMLCNFDICHFHLLQRKVIWRWGRKWEKLISFWLVTDNWRYLIHPFILIL